MSQTALPASARQITYAEDIASELNISLPIDIHLSGVCKKFIDENVVAFNQALEVKEQLKYLCQQTGRVSRWINARSSLNMGNSIEKIAEDMGVKPNTIEKYLNELTNWESRSAGTDEHEVVMKLLVEYNAGINLYEKYVYGHKKI